MKIIFLFFVYYITIQKTHKVQFDQRKVEKRYKRANSQQTVIGLKV